jgi:hypothetical protein
MDTVEYEPFALAKGQHNEPPLGVAPMLEKKFRSLEDAKILVTNNHKCMKHNGRLCYIMKPAESETYAGHHIEMSIALAASYAKAVVCDYRC